jgi:hypothetical protein
MKSVLDFATRDELIARIRALQEHSTREWGKMTVLQMLKHCVLCEKFYFGEIKVPRSFLGRLIGPPVLKKTLKEGNLLSRNAPTSSVLIVADTGGDIEAEKQNWIQCIERYAHLPRNNFTHWFFGTMTPEQLGQFVYKHADHHLRQFNA